MIFHDLFGIDFRIDLFIDFSWKIGPKWNQKVSQESSKIRTFRILFRRSIFGYILVALWLTFGILWSPIGILWVLLAHFWHHLGSNWGPLGGPWLTFTTLWAHL